MVQVAVDDPGMVRPESVARGHRFRNRRGMVQQPGEPENRNASVDAGIPGRILHLAGFRRCPGIRPPIQTIQRSRNVRCHDSGGRIDLVNNQVPNLASTAHRRPVQTANSASCPMEGQP